MKLVVISHCHECSFAVRFGVEVGGAYYVECKLAGKITLPPEELILPEKCPIRDGVELISPERAARENVEYGELAPSKPEEGQFILRHDQGLGHQPRYWSLDGTWAGRANIHIKVFTRRSHARTAVRAAASRTGVVRKSITIEDYAVPHSEAGA